MLTKPPEKEMSFLEHLEELRSRLIKSVVVIIAMAVVVYFFSEKLIDFFTAPLPQVYYMAPTEAFMVRIKLSLIGGAVLAIPVVFYHLWMFIGPGLLKSEARIVIPIVISATIFFLIGAALCFFVMLPVAIKFMLGFSTPKLQPLISIDNYIGFAGMLILAFGLVFELPVASFILGRMGIINARMLSKGRRYAVVVILIASAILTPTPDAFNQLLLAGPMYVLYEISIIVVWFTGRKRGESQ